MNDVFLRIGDELRIPGPLGTTHVMTYVGPLGSWGEDVLDAPKNSPARLIHYRQIIGSLTIGQRGPESWWEQQAVQQRALQVLGTPNRLIGPNCEHISSFVRTGNAESPQLRGFGFVASIVGALILFG
jgi:hypothetical protein